MVRGTSCVCGGLFVQGEPGRTAKEEKVVGHCLAAGTMDLGPVRERAWQDQTRERQQGDQGQTEGQGVHERQPRCACVWA